MNFPDPTKTVREQVPDVLLALLVWGEARGEAPLGKTAVAHVVVNRMREKGLSVAEVVLKPWQFSCFNFNDPNSVLIKNIVLTGAKVLPLGEWAACWTAAFEALNGQSSDVTEGATHYCTKKLWMQDQQGRKIPQWFSKQCVEDGTTIKTVQIGRHFFAKTKW